MSEENHHRSMNCNGRLVEINRPLVMGILNLTPDSFYDGGKYIGASAWESRIEVMLHEGADIIDLGAYSSRPGAENISLEEEWGRLEPVLETVLRKYSSSIVSIDTFRSVIASRAVKDFGISLVNDISGGSMDNKMFDTIAGLEVPYILMHMKGTPQTMQEKPEYGNLMGELFEFFLKKTEELKSKGIKDIIIDPGFGFGKTIDQNYEILASLDRLQIFNMPVLVGISRKSMIYRFLGQDPADALSGTIALNVIAIQKGADIIRVHDVAEAVTCRKLVEKVYSSQ